MPLSTIDECGRRSVDFRYVSGLPLPYREGDEVNLTIDTENKRLAIIHIPEKKPPIALPFYRIFYVEVISETETREVQKNKTGRRALAGALIAGPVGAVVGGMRGLNTKTEKTTRYGVAIDFHTKNGDQSLIFEATRITHSLGKFVAELRECVKRYANRFDPAEYDVIIPREVEGVPLAYKYSVKVNITSRSVLEKMDADNSWELTAEEANGVILLSNRGEILGTLMERVEMMSDWLHRGDPYKMVLEAADEVYICTALLCFYRKKRENDDLNVILSM